MFLEEVEPVIRGPQRTEYEENGKNLPVYISQGL